MRTSVVRWSAWLVIVGLPAACADNGETSTGESPTTASGGVVTDASVDVSLADTQRDPSGEADASAAATEATADTSQSVTVEVSAGNVDETLTGTVAMSLDPFDEFVACSGLRSGFTSYSVLVSNPNGELRAVGLASIGPVSGPGVVDATVRVERASGTPIDALGTMSLDDGLASGEFTAFDAAGERVSGRFECVGGVDLPAPLGEADGEAIVLEVSALLRFEGAERLVGLVAVESIAGALECPGPADDSVVRFDGDGAAGAIGAFELFGGTAPALRLQVGETAYEFVDVTLGAANDGVAGTFAGSSLGVTVDGAYHCE